MSINFKDVKYWFKKLIKSSHRINLTINEEKTKHLIMIRRSVNKTALKVDPYSFEQVDEFKYLGVNINTKNNMHNEIQLRINSTNKAYFAMNKMLSCRLLFKGTKEKLYFFLRSIVMYACETLSTTQGTKKNYSLWKENSQTYSTSTWWIREKKKWKFGNVV